MNDQHLELDKERTKLAAERTFLSWIRTGLTCVGGGIAVIRFLPFQQEAHELFGKVAGLSLMATGTLIFILAFYNYHQNLKHFSISEKNLSFATSAFLTLLLLLLSSVLIFIT